KFQPNRCNSFARILRRDIAPPFVFGAQLRMKAAENLMLKASRLARVSLKQSALIRAQAIANEILERALRECLQRADGRTQFAAIERIGRRCRQPELVRACECVPALPLLDNRCNTGQRLKCWRSYFSPQQSRQYFKDMLYFAAFRFTGKFFHLN